MIASRLENNGQRSRAKTKEKKNRTMKSWVGVGRWVGDQTDAVGMLTHLPDTACTKDQVQNESRMEGAYCGGQSPDSESHFQPVHLIWILFFSLV